jgi:cytochrome P450
MDPEAQVPGPRSRSPFGSFFAFHHNRLQALTQMHERYGDLVRFRLLHQTAYLLGHPDYIRDLLLQHGAETSKSMALRRAKPLLGQGLLTSEPPHHSRQRRLIQPAFHRERIAHYADSMIEVGNEWLAGWEKREISKAPFDLHSEMTQLTLSIVVRALFSADLTSIAYEMSEVTRLVINMFPYLVLPLAEYLEYWPLPISVRFRRARARLEQLIYGLIRERRSAPEPRHDLLSMLIDAQDDQDHGNGMTDAQVRDELLTLFLAGHETTANALTWTWYLLSQNPQAECAFHQELDRVLGSRQPCWADLEELRYTTAVLSESMRLYPPVWGISRLTKRSIDIAGHTIPKGSLCVASQWVTHRDPRFFSDPEVFRPERWLDGSPSWPRFSYFPFGAGTRICIGERFAWTEGALMLALLGQKWKFRVASDVPVEPWPLITLRPRNGLIVQGLCRC